MSIRAPGSGADLPRRVTEGVYWLGGCLQTTLRATEIHAHVSTYLLLGERESLLVDTGHPKDWAAVSDALDAILDSRPLDYVFPTHPELPHAGNLVRLLKKYPEARVCGDVRDYHLYHPELIDRFEAWSVGDSVDLGGLEFVVTPAIVRDLPNSQWGFEKVNGVLFVADAFGFAHHHGVGECAMFAEDMTELPDVELVHFITDAALYWTRFHDIQSSIDAVVALRETHPTRILAPAHGNLIREPDGLTADAILRGYAYDAKR